MAVSQEDLIVKLRLETKQLNKDLDKAKNRLKRFKGSIGKIGAGIKRQLLTAFGGAVILQGITSAVKSLAEFELVMDKVHATSGASAGQLKALTDNALNLGRTTKFTAGEIGNLQLELSKLGFSTSKILATTAAVTKLALVTDEDLGEAAKTLAGTLNSFNLEASQSERIANLMAESFTKSALTLEKFTVGTSNSGATATAFGVTVESNTARLAKLVDANIDASKAGTDLRKIYMELNTAGMTYNEALEMVSNSSNKLSAAQNLVGVRAAGALLILTQQRKAVNGLTGEFTDNNREIDKQADIVKDNLTTSWALFLSALDGVIQKATPVRNALKEMLDGFTKLTNSLIPDDIKARDAAFEKFTKALNQFGDTKDGLNDVGVAFAALDGKVEKAERALSDWVDLNTNINKVILPTATKSVAELDAEYQKLKNTIAGLAGEDMAYKARIEAITDALKAQAKALKDLNDAAEIRQQSIPFQSNPMQARLTQVHVREGIEQPDSLSTAQAVLDSMKKLREGMSAEALAIESMMRNLDDNLKMIMSDIAQNIIVNFAEAIGNGGGLEAAFKGILTTLGDGLIQIGKFLVSYGVSMTAIQKALTSGLAGHPGLAIAAGAAAIVAGAALKSGVARSNKSTLGGGGSVGSGSFSGQRQGQSINVNVQGQLVADGRSLVAVFNQQQRSDTRNIG